MATFITAPRVTLFIQQDPGKTNMTKRIRQLAKKLNDVRGHRKKDDAKDMTRTQYSIDRTRDLWDNPNLPWVRVDAWRREHSKSYAHIFAQPDSTDCL